MKIKQYFLNEAKRDEIIANIQKKEDEWNKIYTKVLKIKNKLELDIQSGKLNDKQALKDIKWIHDSMNKSDIAFSDGFSTDMTPQKNLDQFKMWGDPDIKSLQKMKKGSPDFEAMRKLMRKKYPGEIK